MAQFYLKTETSKKTSPIKTESFLMPNFDLKQTLEIVFTENC